jgi:glycosyltransferase involved in cell wall biosynthesis
MRAGLNGDRQLSPVADQKRTILYFGNDWFAENRTSSHQIARCLAKKHRVYYLECPGLRAPQGSGRDLKKIVAKLWRFIKGSQRIEIAPSAAGSPAEALYVRTLFQIPLHRFAVVRALNRWLLWCTIRWLILREGIRSPLAWHMVPHLATVAGTLGEQAVVYYCIDDYASLPDVDASSVRAMDEELTRRADVVFVASATLLERKRKLNPHTYVSPHGVETEHFARAQSSLMEVPDDIRQLARPIIGFFGLIERWIDLGLVAELARRRPNWSFVMLGRVAVPDAEVPSAPNIYFLGHRPYSQLPAYGKAFDVAMIPYRSTEQVHNANPIKLREYLAMGKPVVTVRTPEIEKFQDVVAIADSACQFEANIESALGPSANTAGAISQRQERVSDMSWVNVVARTWKIIESAGVASEQGSSQTPSIATAAAIRVP